MTIEKTRVLIVDDHAVVRTAFRQLIDATEDLEATGEAGTSAAAIKELAKGRYDVVLLDVSLPDAGVMETVAAIQRKEPKPAILIVSMHAEETYAINLMRAGVSGFFEKSGSANDMLQAIRTVASGKKYVSARLAQTLAMQSVSDTPAAPHQALSPRELQIFIQLAAGNTVTHVAEKLFLSVKTVSSHRTRILEKMNFTTNADITAYAVKNHLLT